MPMKKISTLFLQIGNIDKPEVIQLDALFDMSSEQNRRVKKLMQKAIHQAPQKSVDAILNFAKKA